MKEDISWPAVFSFVLPGLGQISRLRLIEGYIFFILFNGSLALSIFISPFYLITSLIIHILNILDCLEILGDWK